METGKRETPHESYVLCRLRGCLGIGVKFCACLFQCERLMCCCIGLCKSPCKNEKGQTSPGLKTVWPTSDLVLTLLCYTTSETLTNGLAYEMSQKGLTDEAAHPSESEETGWPLWVDQCLIAFVAMRGFKFRSRIIVGFSFRTNLWGGTPEMLRVFRNSGEYVLWLSSLEECLPWKTRALL
jgi:hypothetical protein